MVMSGQYASYWNAFFFQLDLNITHSKFTLMHELSHFGLDTLTRLRLYA